MRALAAHFLVDAGHCVELATDGHEALAKIGVRAPELLITEILVPKLDGLALCRHVKAAAQTPSILVLVLSVLAAGTRAKQAGADGFLLKPLAQHRLIAMVRDLDQKRSPMQPPAQERS